MFEKRYIGTIFKSSADFTKFAESFGAEGLRVEKDTEIKYALKTAVKSDLPFVMDVIVDPDAPLPPIAGEWYEPVKHQIKPRPRKTRRNI